MSLAVVKELYQANYLSGIDASGANAMCYMNLQITVPGREYLKKLKQERTMSRIKKGVFAAIVTIGTPLIIAWLSKYLGLSK